MCVVSPVVRRSKRCPEGSVLLQLGRQSPDAAASPSVTRAAAAQNPEAGVVTVPTVCIFWVRGLPSAGTVLGGTCVHGAEYGRSSGTGEEIPIFMYLRLYHVLYMYSAKAPITFLQSLPPVYVLRTPSIAPGHHANSRKKKTMQPIISCGCQCYYYTDTWDRRQSRPARLAVKDGVLVHAINGGCRCIRYPPAFPRTQRSATEFNVSRFQRAFSASVHGTACHPPSLLAVIWSFPVTAALCLPAFVPDLLAKPPSLQSSFSLFHA